MTPIERPRDEPSAVDRSALTRMLTYVEAECRRLGALEAAAHAALAAGLVHAAATRSHSLH